MNNLIVEAPLNSLSFGNVSYNILRELFRKNVEVGLFTQGQVDISAFPVDSAFASWIEESINKRWDVLSSKAPTLKLWHLNGGENRKSDKQNLLTFHECSAPTKTEVAICKSQNKTIFSSSYSKSLFEEQGCNNCEFVPIGFDKDLHVTNKKYLTGVIHFGLMGKFEKRKNTEAIIKTWLKNFGNDNRYQLSCCVTNPFFKPEQTQAIMASILGGKRYTNINFLPYLKTNMEVNELLNAIDIDLTGLSLAEGWNLPAFNATCLGKWSIVANHTAHKDWANEDNSILLEPSCQVDSHDGFFFVKGAEYNQGNFFGYSEEEMSNAMNLAVKKFVSKNVNTAGLELAKKMSYSNTVDCILNTF
jgi:hypothetical protein